MKGPLLAAASFAALLALGWWQRRQVPVDTLVVFRANPTGSRELTWVTDDGQGRRMGARRVPRDWHKEALVTDQPMYNTDDDTIAIASTMVWCGATRLER